MTTKRVREPKLSLGWMFDIVANKTNSLDVDKIDYLQRDSKSLGLVTLGFNQSRIL